jgi:23S rRNA pseudouridine1911/1915/1917 synthase
MSQTEQFEITVTEDVAGLRLDQALARLLPQFSRSRLKEWVLNGNVTVDGVTRKPRDRVVGGELLRVRAETPPAETVEPEPISLQVLYEDESIIVIDKPPGLVVHPGAGNPRGTLQNALLHHRPELAEVPRAGIVHRLDKDTSGVMVVAAGVTDHTDLVRQLEQRSVQREYRAVCDGVLTAGGTVDAPIGRHPGDRLRMAVRQGGRPAVTHYRVVERFRAHTDLRATLETGRTHQIRVHMAHLGYPLVGDRTYGGRLRVPKGAGEELRQTLRGFRRQALHAVRLKLIHPRSGEEVEFTSPLRVDHESLLANLRRDAEAMRDG